MKYNLVEVTEYAGKNKWVLNIGKTAPWMRKINLTVPEFVAVFFIRMNNKKEVTLAPKDTATNKLHRAEYGIERLKKYAEFQQEVDNE